MRTFVHSVTFAMLGAASCQADIFQILYAANVDKGDSFINATNTGANGAALNGPGFGEAAGNI